MSVPIHMKRKISIFSFSGKIKNGVTSSMTLVTDGTWLLFFRHDICSYPSADIVSASADLTNQ
jgi:hypothetical protein